MVIRMRSLIVFVVMASALFLQAVPPAAANTAPLPGLEHFMDEIVLAYLEEQNIPNAAISVVAGGEVVFLKGYGYADLEQRTPVNPENTLFRTGSVAKLITWTAVMQLVEQGVLDLHADVNEYLDFRIPSHLIHSRDSSTPAPVTLAHLMTHTAGFEAYPDAIFRLSADRLLPLDEYVRTHMPQRAFPPGELAAYSNYGAALAGYIVQQVSGVPFAEYIEEHIFAPLGMNDSTFRQPVPPEMEINLARPYRYVKGEYLPGVFEYMQEPEGSLSSTAADMAKFMLAHLNGGSYKGGRILQETTLRQMHSPQPGRYPGQGGMALGFMKGVYNSQPVLFHGGSTAVFDSGLYLLPEKNAGIFINYSGGSHILHGTLFQSFLDRYYPADNSAAAAAPEGMLERSRQYAGEYQQNNRSFTTAESFTSLMMGIINVSVDDEGYLLVTHVNETDHFIEVEQGVYQNLREGRSQDYFGPFRILVFDTDPLGRMMLTPDGPMTYSRALWYASAAFTLPALVLILLVMLVSLIVWGAGFVTGLFRRRGISASRTASFARAAGGVFALLAVVFLVGLVMNGEPHPVYLLPMPAFGIVPAWDSALNIIPYLLVLLGAGVVGFTVLAWRKGFWQLPGRIHYTLFSAAGLGLLWIFYYWNVF
jgi:CubicO group peptidase (beta-lactamase class C family)